MKNETLVYCPLCGGEGRIMEAKLFPSGHTEVMEVCQECDGYGDGTYEYYINQGYKHSDLTFINNPIIENFQIY